MMFFKVSEQFTKSPGGRLRENGDHSGEELRDDYIIPLLDGNPDEKLVIDFNGIYGISSSTMDEIFYGLVMKKGKEINDRIEIVSSNSIIRDMAISSMNDAIKDDRNKGVIK